MTLLLVRFAVLAGVVAALAVVGFAVVARLRRRGRWEQTRERWAPVVSRAAQHYRTRSGSGVGRALTQAAARGLDPRRGRQ